MSSGVQITLIICVTIIILSIISSIKVEYKSDNKVEHCKSPTYPRLGTKDIIDWSKAKDE